MALITEHPGCYGFTVAVSASSPSCQVCPVRVGCVFEASELLNSLPNTPLTARERLALTVTRIALTATPRTNLGGEPQPVTVAPTTGLTRITLSPAQLAEVATFPERVGKQVKQLMERGWFEFARAELKARRNPATKGWKKTFCAMLLKGSCTRQTLELALVEQLGLSPASARVQTSVGMSIFAAGRIATEQFGRFTLSPN